MCHKYSRALLTEHRKWAVAHASMGALVLMGTGISDGRHLVPSDHGGLTTSWVALAISAALPVGEAIFFRHVMLRAAKNGLLRR